MNRQPIHYFASTSFQHPPEVFQVIHPFRIAYRCQGWGQSPAKDHDVGIGGLRPEIYVPQQRCIPFGVHRPVAPFQADVWFVPDNNVVHAPPEVLDEGLDIVTEGSILFFSQVGKGSHLLLGIGN